MSTAPDNKRTDTASRLIKATPQTLYRAFVDPAALASWLPPQGMTGEIQHFDLREGGSYRMSLTYKEAGHAAPGKTSEHADVVEARFLKLVPNQRLVQQVEFDSPDPAFAGAMIVTWTLAAVPGGTEVTVVCENVPDGISADDHDKGLRSTLENLAAFTE